MADSLTLVEGEVRELVKQRGIDLMRCGQEAVGRLVDEVLCSYDPCIGTVDLPLIEDRATLRKAIVDRMAEFGPFQVLFDDPQMGETWINDPGKVSCARGGQGRRLSNEPRLRQVVTQR